MLYITETDARKLSKWWTKGDGGALKEQCVSVLDDGEYIQAHYTVIVMKVLSIW